MSADPAVLNSGILQRLPYLRIVMIAALILSCTATALFVHEDLQNAHFDSKAHQLVARRIFDSLRPGWIQIGAFWLPLPHVLYAALVRNDTLYFSGLAGTPFSMLSYLLTVFLIFKLIEKVLDSFSAFCGSILYLTNPNILYLQSTALTENLMILFMVTSTWLLMRYVETRQIRFLWLCAISCAAGILTRYENWMVFGMIGLILIAIDVLQKQGIKTLLKNGFILGIVGFSAMALTFWINWYTTGHLMLNIKYKYMDFQFGKDSYLLSFFVCLFTLANLVSFEWMVIGFSGFISQLRKRYRDPIFLSTLALAGPFILNMIEYHNNLPTRIRYGLSFVPICTLFAATWVNRKRILTYLFFVFFGYTMLSSVFYERYSSQLLEESMRDINNIALQSDLLHYLHQNDDGKLILVAMGDIAPVIYDLKLPIKRYVHEGVKPWWNDARAHPEQVVGWVFLSQDDKLWQRFHDDPEFHKHFALIGQRHFLELYRLTPDEQSNIKSHRPHSTEEKGVNPF